MAIGQGGTFQPKHSVFRVDSKSVFFYTTWEAKLVSEYSQLQSFLTFFSHISHRHLICNSAFDFLIQSDRNTMNLISTTEFLDKYIFSGLRNMNDGFDAPSIKYFSAADFEIVLHRVQKLGLGIHGIEPWKDGEFYRVLTYEDFTGDPTDCNWYWKAFQALKDDGQELQYAASYHVPDEVLASQEDSGGR